MKKTLRITAIGATALLVACGSSDKKGSSAINVTYTGPTSSVALTSTAAIGGITTGATSSLAGISGASGGAVGATGVAGAKARANAQAAVALVGQILKATPSLAGVTQSQTQQCPGGGSETASFTVYDPDYPLAYVGDSVSVSFAACKDVDGSMVTGAFTMAITATDGALIGDLLSMAADTLYEVTLTFTDWVQIDPSGSFAGIDGEEVFGMYYDSGTGWLDSSISGTSLVAAEGLGQTITSAVKLSGPGNTGDYSLVAGARYPSGLDYAADADSSAVTARICSTDAGGCLEVETSPALVVAVGDGYPSSGTITYSDDMGRFVEITATDGVTGDITVYYDIGAGTVGPVYTTWDCLDQEDSSSCFP
jgi:hypothetical protein